MSQSEREREREEKREESRDVRSRFSELGQGCSGQLEHAVDVFEVIRVAAHGEVEQRRLELQHVLGQHVGVLVVEVTKVLVKHFEHVELVGEVGTRLALGECGETINQADDNLARIDLGAEQAASLEDLTKGLEMVLVRKDLHTKEEAIRVSSMMTCYASMYNCLRR